MKRRLIYFLEAVVLFATLWAGLFGSLLTTPIAALVLPAFVLSVLGIALPRFVASRRALRLYVDISAAVGLAEVIFVLGYMSYVSDKT